MARYVVTNSTFSQHLEAIKEHNIIALDTETTGLNSYLGAQLFSIIISTAENDYYFNFNDKPDHLGSTAGKDYIIPMECVAGFFSELLNRENLTIFAHNFKFDAHMLHKEKIRFSKCKWFCTEAG